MKQVSMVVVGLILAFTVGATIAAAQPSIVEFLQTYLGVGPPEKRPARASGAAKGASKTMAGIIDAGETAKRQEELTPIAKKELEGNPDGVFVVELLVPDSDTGTEHIIRKENFTSWGTGSDVYDALARNNPIKAGNRPSAIDHKRSRFLVARLVDGEIYWRFVPRPQPDVLREKVAAARARATAVPVPNPPITARVQPITVPRSTMKGLGGPTPHQPEPNDGPSHDLSDDHDYAQRPRDDDVDLAEQAAVDRALELEAAKEKNPETITLNVPKIDAPEAPHFNQPSIQMNGERTPPSVEEGNQSNNDHDGSNAGNSGNSGSDNSSDDKGMEASTWGDGARVYSDFLDCCDWDKLSVKPETCKVTSKGPDPSKPGNRMVVLTCGQKVRAKE